MKNKPTERDYQKYIGDSFKEFSASIEELSKRLADLEEKERERSREDHNREINLESYNDNVPIWKYFLFWFLTIGVVVSGFLLF